MKKDVNVFLDVNIKKEGAVKATEVSSQETEMLLVEILKSSKGFNFSKISHIYELGMLKTTLSEGWLAENDSPEEDIHILIARICKC